MISLVTVIAATLALVTSLPIGNSTVSDDAEPSFVSQPKGRGTVDILLNCLITLVLCVWTAIHLNIIKNPNRRRILRTRILYVLVGLFAPEIVLATAYKEWREATKLFNAAQRSNAVKTVQAVAKQFTEVSGAFERLIADKSASKAVTDPEKADELFTKMSNVLDRLREVNKLGLEIIAGPESVRKAPEPFTQAPETLNEPVADPKSKPRVAKPFRASSISETLGKAKPASGVVKEVPDSFEALKKSALDALQNHGRAVGRFTELSNVFETLGKANELALKTFTDAAPAVFTTNTEVGQPGAAKGRPDLEIQLDEVTVLEERPNNAQLDVVTLLAKQLNKIQKYVEEIQLKEHHLSFFERVGKWFKRLTKTQPDAKPMFNMECAFFAVMGGYTLLPFNTHDTPYDHTYERTLTTGGLAFLLENDFISASDLATFKSDIKDKEKADVLAKFLTCAQVLWMMINCLSRKVAGLPITLIEINVVVHVFCVVFMYWFWLKKPHNAGQAISLSPKFLDYRISSLIYIHADPDITIRPLTSDHPLPLNPAPPFEINQPNLCIIPAKGEEYTTAKEIKIDASKLNDVVLGQNQMLLDKTSNLALTLNRERDSSKGDLNILINAVLGAQDPKSRSLRPFDRRIYDHNITLLSTSGVRIGFRKGNHIFCAAIPLCLAYGGIHASAWNSHFPTPIERQLWRISCIIIASPGLGFCVVAVGGWLALLLLSCLWGNNWSECWRQDKHKVINPTLKRLEGIIDAIMRLNKIWLKGFGVAIFFLGPVGGIAWTETHPYPNVVRRAIEILLVAMICLLTILLGKNVKFMVQDGRMDFLDFVFVAGLLIALVFLFLYLGARVYIVVESFLSLRSLPRGSFETVTWQNLWPHL